MSILPDTSLILDSLGWAVLHSLWQGALAAFAIWVFRAATRESAADTRYMVSFVTLCALFTAFIGTFLYYYGAGMGGVSIDAVLSQTINITTPAGESAGSVNPLTHITNYTNMIGALWALGFAVLGVRYLAAFRLTHKLRTTGLSDLPSNWQTRFTALAGKSGVSGKVRGYISEHVSSPITFGFFKPIVLVPAWFFTGMSAEQCEAVLLHEFAHIRRHDYLTNILQIIIKTVFFYHPAVQYICKTINTDREHACDDFAAVMSKNPESLATALGTIRLKAARSGGVFALSADGRDAPLMHRLKRLMGTPTKPMRTGSSRSTAAAIMIVAASASLLTLGASESLAHPHKADAETLAGAAVPTPKVWGQFVDDTVTVNGKAYNSTAFAVTNDGGEYYTINGKEYPSKYSYSVYARDGKDYVVKQKNGKRYMEISDNWYRVDANSATGSTVMPTPPAPPKYAYSYHKVNGQKYKTKTNTVKNQTFIKVRGKWYDIDETDLDTLLPAPAIPAIPSVAEVPATPAVPSVSPTNYSYGYAVKDGKTYKVKTKNGKSYIKIDNKWRKASIKGGDDHGHRHVKIDDRWYNIENDNSITAIVNTQVQASLNGVFGREGITVVTDADGATHVRSGGVKIITDKHGNTSVDLRDGQTSTLKSGYVYGYVTKNGQAHLVKTEQKSGKSYAQFGNTWVHVKNKWNEGQRSPSKVKINGKWYDLSDTTFAAAPTPPTPPSTNYWISDQEREATMARAERAWERTEEARERAEDQREAALERAEDLREAERDRANDHREAALERAEEQREAVFERAEEQRIRAQEQVVRAQERTIRDQERAIRAQERQVRNQERQVRAQEQRERAREHVQAEAERRHADVQRGRYEEMRDRLLPRLKADGYMPRSSSKVTIKMTENDIFINGKQLPNAQESQYCDIVSDYIDRKGAMKTIVIKPGYLHVRVKDKDSNSSYTFNE